MVKTHCTKGVGGRDVKTEHCIRNTDTVGGIGLQIPRAIAFTFVM